MGLTKRKDSYYVEFRVLDDGQVLTLAHGPSGGRLKRWKVGCRNKETAKQQEAIIRTKLLHGLNYASKENAPEVTFGGYAERWLDRAKGELAPKTYANYKQLLKLYVLPAYKDRNISELTWADIKTYLMGKQQTGLSINTIRLIRATISTVLTDAAEEGVIPVNPVLGQRRKRRASQNKGPDVHPLTWEQKQVEVLSIGV